MWQKKLLPYIESGQLVAIGVVQEQHADRARLYRQWRQLGWPIAVDSLGLLDHRAVPIPMGLDARGVVRARRLRPDGFEKTFMAKDFSGGGPPLDDTRGQKPDLAALEKRARRGGASIPWRDLGDGLYLEGGLYLHGGAARLGEAIGAYRRAVKLAPGDGRAHFRLGVALRARYDSKHRDPRDEQAAVDSWGRALEADPGQYIWRRRIQQYGPRLDKPYNFYFWVAKARREIRARGEEPLPLSVEPTGSEIAEPLRGKASVGPGQEQRKDPDPFGRIPKDRRKLVRIEPVVTPARVRPGHRVRVRVTFRLDEKTHPLWNNEAGGLSLWVRLPATCQLDEGEFEHRQPSEPETRETRTLEFEAGVAADTKQGEIVVPAYALYDVCLDEEGVCYRYRQDFEITVRVDPKAPKIQ